MTLESLITMISSFFSGFLDWAGEMIDFVVGQPILMVFIIIALVGIVIKVVKGFIPGKGV